VDIWGKSCGNFVDISLVSNKIRGLPSIKGAVFEGKNCIFRAMEHGVIEDIVHEAFEKAKGEHAVHSTFALATHIGDHCGLSSKTVQKLHKKYIEKDGSQRKPNASSIDQLCSYLGYENYGKYREARRKEGRKGPGRDTQKKDVATKKNKLVLPIIVVLVGALTFAAIKTVWQNGGHEGCMTWADSLYIKVSCDVGPYSRQGAQVVPLDEMKLKNFKKVKVDMSTEFFSEQTGKPLIWYFKISKDELEFFTAPGLHPLTGETLKGITEYIIEKYVPKHQYRPDSFLGDP